MEETTGVETTGGSDAEEVVLVDCVHSHVEPVSVQYVVHTSNSRMA
jgi:hypothetical protein